MRQLLKNRWLIVLVLLLLLLLLAAVCLLPFPRTMKVTQQGVLWACDNPDLEQLTTVTIYGTYWDYLLLEDRFEGSVRVEAFPETQGQISIVPMGEGQYAMWYADEEMLMKAFGGMFLRSDSSVMLQIYEDGQWDAQYGKVLTAPALTRAKAVALANELANELSPNWLGMWTFE